MYEAAWPDSIRDLQGYYVRRCRELNVADGRDANAPAAGAISWQASREDAALYAEADRRWRLVPAADRLLAAMTSDLAAQHTADSRAQARQELLDAMAAYQKAAQC